MLTNCPRCNAEIEKTIESARSHVRHKHGNLTDKAKIKLRDSIVPFVETGGFGKARTKEENELCRKLGIK